MAIVTRGATFSGTDFVQVVGGQVRIALRCVAGGPESGGRVRGVDTIIPSASGRSARNRVYDGRTITLEGWVAGTGATYDDQLADFIAAQLQIVAAFDPTASPDTLEIDLGNGSIASIEARTLPEEPMWGDDSNPIYRELSIDLEAVGDDWLVAGS